MSNLFDEVRIETPRLVLRIYAPEDFAELREMSADERAFRFSERGPMSSDEAWSRLLRHVGHWAALGYGAFAVEDRGTGRFAGEAGLGDFKRGLGSDFDDFPEATWSIAPWAQGRGYATEAAEAALRWTEAKLTAPRTVCLIHQDNAASHRIAEKLGYRPFGRCTYRGYEAVMQERLRG